MEHVVSVSMASLSEGLGSARTFTGSGRLDVDETIAGNTTDRQIAFALDVSACKSLFILSDQILTIETNSGGVPVDTLVLKANVPYFWNADCYDAFVFDTDITSIFVTNGTSEAASLKIRALMDVTP